MKKKYIYMIAGILLLTGCDKKEDNIFSVSPDERLTESLQEYQDILNSSPNGWLLSINTKAGGGYRFWLSFNDDNRVTMLSDLDYTIKGAGQTSVVPKESSYRLKGLMAPSIIFDTYSYLHVLADPQAAVNGGSSGAGLESDFEFSFIKADNGRLYLRGNFNECTAYMDPVSPAELESIMQGGLTSVYQGLNDYLDAHLFPTILVGDSKLLAKPSARTVDFAYMDEEENVVESSVGAYIDLKSLTGPVAMSDIHFFEPVSILGKTFTDMVWDEQKGCYLMESGDDEYEVFDNQTPPYPMNFGYGGTFAKLHMEADKMVGTVPQAFMDDFYTPAYNSLQGNKRTILYVECIFSLNATSQKPQMELWIRYQNSAGSAYTAKWYFSYQENEDGTLTFLDREQSGSSNERGQEPYLKKLVDFFCEVEYSKYSTSSWSESVKSKVTPHTFRRDWVPNKTQGLTGNIGGLYRVDNEEWCIAGQLTAK